MDEDKAVNPKVKSGTPQSFGWLIIDKKGSVVTWEKPDGQTVTWDYYKGPLVVKKVIL